MVYARRKKLVKDLTADCKNLQRWYTKMFICSIKLDNLKRI